MPRRYRPFGLLTNEALCLALLLLSVLLSSIASVVCAAPAKPRWETACDSPFTHCSTVETYMDWEKSSGELTFQVNARMANQKEGVTLWYVGDSYSEALGGLQRDTGINVVQIKPRGAPGGSPSFGCAREELDAHCRPTPKCAERLGKYSPDIFSVEQAAMDLDWAIKSLNQPEKPVVVMGEGYGSVVAMRYMKNNANGSFAAILLNPVHPNLYNHFYDMWANYDAAMQHLLQACDQSTLCSVRLGATEGAWHRLLNILNAAKQGHLPCEAKLGWGTGASFELAIRNQLAAMLLPMHATLSPADPGLASLIPAFLYRLQRCNAEDVEALQKLRKQTVDKRIDACSPEIPLRWLWLVNELTPDAYKSDGKLVPSAASLGSTARSTRAVLPVSAAIDAFAAFYKAIPKYERQKSEDRLLFTKSKTLIVYADLDPLLPLTQANTLALTYTDGNTHFRHPATRAVHLPSSGPLYQCIRRNLDQFKRDGQWAPENGCYDAPTTVDGGLDFLQGNPSLYFGLNDPWTFTVPNAPEPSEGRVKPKHSSSTVMRLLKRILWALLWLSVIAGVLGAAYVAYTRWSFGRTHSTDDFYDSLHR